MNKIKLPINIIFALFTTVILSAGEILVVDNPDVFRLFNKKTGKILNYYFLPADNDLEATLIDIDTLIVYTRIFTEVEKNYQYQIVVDGKSKTVTRKARPSNVSKGLDGQIVSSYNSYLRSIGTTRSKIVLNNDSGFDLLVKLRGKNQNSAKQDIDYVRFSPNTFDEEKIIIYNNKAYTYFSAKEKNISFSLEGPVMLKIISRLIFPDNLTSRFNYRYTLELDRKEFSTFTETAYPSSKSVLKDEHKIISTGDVNIVKIPSGIHEVRIKDIDVNRDLLFRLYINKSAVEPVE